jgi:transglutaminase-like putative cysteine protease
VSFARDKRLLLGLLALLAPAPLPFNDVLGWPVLLAYWALVVVFLRRAWRDAASWLPSWAMNLLGIAYLPVLYVDMVVFWSGQLVRPVIHLALFAVGVKLFALRQERDKWHVLIGCFFLFLAAMGTSVHPGVMLYLVAFVALALALLARFAYFAVLARFGYRREEPARAPLRGFIVGATAAALLLAAPLFALLPRIRTPYLLVRGTGTGTVIKAAGFGDLITLDSIGSARAGHEVLLRLRFSPQPRPRREIRLKAETYDRYDGRTWRANSGAGRATAPEHGTTFRLGPGAPRQQAEVWLLPWNSPSLPLPVQSVAVTLRTPSLARDRGGAVSLYYVPATTLRYDVDLADHPVLDDLPAPDIAVANEATRGTAGVTPRIAALAAQLMGQGDPQQRAERLEERLGHDYQYTTEFVGRSGQLALEDFLFRSRRGHCEFFATAMVVMLRSQGIPARFVTGFLGGDENAFEGYYVVRQSNAHAWVEAWIPGVGWEVFDPTPAAGRPGALERDLPVLVSEIWDYLKFRWDRYVLTFGFYDQLSLLLQVRSAWLSFWQAFQRHPAAPEGSVPETPVVQGARAPGNEGWSWERWRLPLALSFVAIAVIVVIAVLWQRRRRQRTATAIYSRLRERLEKVGLPVPPSLAPLSLVRVTGARFPAAAAATRKLVDLYLRESYADEVLAERDLGSAAQSLRHVEDVLRKAG